MKVTIINPNPTPTHQPEDIMKVTIINPNYNPTPTQRPENNESDNNKPPSPLNDLTTCTFMEINKHQKK